MFLSDLEKQIFKDFEIIIVDDGSKDNSVKIVEEYAKTSAMDLKLIISSQNNGVSEARNIGLSKANDHYIYFVDFVEYLFVININCLRNVEYIGVAKEIQALSVYSI
ncbi:MAG: glycosyltransferase [Candidatus Aenigmatarchaeota archaeon]